MDYLTPFVESLRRNKPLARGLEALIASGGLRMTDVKSDPERNVISGSLDLGPAGRDPEFLRRHPEARVIVQEMTRHPPDNLEATLRNVALLTSGHVLAAGPRSFRPTAEQAEALAAVEIRVPFTEYTQPFETFIVEVPEAFAERRPLLNLRFAGSAPNAIPSDTLGRLVIMHHRARENWLVTTLVSREHYTRSQLFVTSATETVEDQFSAMLRARRGEIARYGRNYQAARAQDIANGDIPLLETAIARLAAIVDHEMDFWRMSLNACLLLTHFGCAPEKVDRQRKRLESYVQKARQRLRKGDTSGPSILESERNLRLHPQRYHIQQDVQLVKHVRREAGPGEPSGRVSPPHQVRGHWKMQACGTGRKERKKIFIAPYFVNWHLFLGQPGSAQLRYELRDREETPHDQGGVAVQ